MMPNGGRVCVPSDESITQKQVAYNQAWLKKADYGDTKGFKVLNSKLSDTAINALNFRWVLFSPAEHDNSKPEIIFDLTGSSWDSEQVRWCTPFTMSLDEAKRGSWRQYKANTPLCTKQVCNFGRAHFETGPRKKDINIWAAYSWRPGGGCGNPPAVIQGRSYDRKTTGAVNIFVYDETPKLANPNAYSLFREVSWSSDDLNVALNKETRIRVYDLWKGIDGVVDIDFVRLTGCNYPDCGIDASTAYSSGSTTYSDDQVPTR